MTTRARFGRRPPLAAADIDRVCGAMRTLTPHEREALRKRAHKGDAHARFTVSALMLQRNL